MKKRMKQRPFMRRSRKSIDRTNNGEKKKNCVEKMGRLRVGNR